LKPKAYRLHGSPLPPMQNGSCLSSQASGGLRGEKKKPSDFCSPSKLATAGRKVTALQSFDSVKQLLVFKLDLSGSAALGGAENSGGATDRFLLCAPFPPPSLRLSPYALGLSRLRFLVVPTVRRNLGHCGGLKKQGRLGHVLFKNPLFPKRPGGNTSPNALD